MSETGLTAAPDAPPEPPVVHIEGVKVDPAYYEWTIDGHPTTYKAAPREDDVDLPAVHLPDPHQLRISVGSPVRPADLAIVLFDEVDRAGVPVSGPSTQIDCLRDARCELIMGAESIDAVVSVDHSPRIAVLHLLYADVLADGNGVDHYSGSWGFKVGGRER